MPEPKAKSFRATLERMRSRLNWVIVPIPFDAAKLWGQRGQIRVRGEINQFAFRTSLFPDGRGGHYLLVNRVMQKGGRAVAGQLASFRLEPDADQGTHPLPAELSEVLREDRSLRRWFDGLNYSIRNEINKWVSGVKSAEARRRRAEQIGERLLATMEAEKELPPLLQRAFPAASLAARGWESMSAARRRMHLLGIFYYRGPEARNRRISRAVAEAETIAARKGHA